MIKHTQPKTYSEVLDILSDNNILTFESEIPSNILDLPSGVVKFGAELDKDSKDDLLFLAKRVREILSESILFSFSNRDRFGRILDQDKNGNSIPYIAGLYSRVDNYTLRPNIDLDKYIIIDINSIDKTIETKNPIWIPKTTEIVVYDNEDNISVDNHILYKIIYYTINITEPVYAYWY